MTLQGHLVFSPPLSAAMNMALDEALTQAAAPVLRFHQYNRPSITIGRFENIGRTLNLAACQKAGIPLARRITGGRAVYHEGDCTFSFIIPGQRDPKSISSGPWYEGLARGVQEALGRLGVETKLETRSKGERQGPCFAATAQHELTAGGKKILGMAQRRTGEWIMIQNTLLMSPAALHFAGYLNGLSKELLAEKLTYLEAWLSPTEIRTLQDLLALHIGEALHIVFAEINCEHAWMELAEKLAVARYAQETWNLHGKEPG